MAEQTLEIRRQRGGFLEELERLEELDSLERLEELDSLERLEGLEELERLEARRRAIAQHGEKPSYIRVTRARLRALQEFYLFAVTSVT